MKVLLLFSNSTVRRGKAFPDELHDLLQYAADQSGSEMEFYVGYARSLSFLISNGRVRIRDHRNRRDLEDYDFVYFRKAGAAMQQMQSCAYYLRDKGVPFWDKELLHANSRNKLTQMVMLERKGLPIPATLFCRNRKRLVRLVTKTYADIFTFPIILKATGGSRGEANYLIQTKDELLERVIGEPNRSFMVQEYIPNNGDYRFFVAGGLLHGIIGRATVSGSHLSNTSKGSQATVLPLESFDIAVRTQAMQAAQLFGRDVAGVDIMFDENTGKHYFLEINRAPQIEKASFENEKAAWMVEAISQSIANHQPFSPVFERDGKRLIGRFEYVRFDGYGDTRIVAKTDTGADTSSLHADHIHEAAGMLQFQVHGIHMQTANYFRKRVRSSTGQMQERYLVTVPITIGGATYRMKTTLSDRSDMKHDMLIGRRFLRENGLIVDVSRRFILSSKKVELA